jgi:5-methylcytosine-specific restriction endonuclease McrA
MPVRPVPVRPELRKFYGYHWRKHVRPPILFRARGKCEHCGKKKRLHVAHLDGVPGHDAPENLAALCPRCHNRLDYRVAQPKARETRMERKDLARPLLEAMKMKARMQALHALLFGRTTERSD